jgi:hypothetical protein
MAKRIEEQSNGGSILIIQAILFILGVITVFTIIGPIVCFIMIFVVGACKKTEVRCSNCNAVLGDGNKCWQCKEDLV